MPIPRRGSWPQPFPGKGDQRALASWPCIEQIQVHMEAEKSRRRDGCSALFRERLSEKDLPDWESLKLIGDKDAALLPSQQRDIH